MAANSYSWVGEKKKEAMIAKMRSRGLPDYRQRPLSERYGVSYTGLGQDGKLDRNAPMGIDNTGAVYHEGEYKASLPEGNVYINSDVSKMMNPPTGQDQAEMTLYAQKGNLPGFASGGANLRTKTTQTTVPTTSNTPISVQPSVTSPAIRQIGMPISGTRRTNADGSAIPTMDLNRFKGATLSSPFQKAPRPTLVSDQTIPTISNTQNFNNPTTIKTPGSVESPLAGSMAPIQFNRNTTPQTILSPNDAQIASGDTGVSATELANLNKKKPGFSPNDAQIASGDKGVSNEQLAALNKPKTGPMTFNLGKPEGAQQANINLNAPELAGQTPAQTIAPTTTPETNVGRDYLAGMLDPNNPLYNSAGGVAARQLSLKQQQERSALEQRLAQEGVTGDRARLESEALQATQEGQANDLAAQYGIAGMQQRANVAGTLMNFDEDKSRYKDTQGWKTYEAALAAGDYTGAAAAYKSVTGKDISMDQMKLQQSQANTITGLNIQNLQTATGVADASAVSNLLGQGFSIDEVNSKLGTHITSADALAIYNNTPAGERDYNRNLGMAQVLLGDPNTAAEGAKLLSNMFPGSGIDFSGMVTSANSAKFNSGLSKLSDYVAAGMKWDDVKGLIGKDGTLAALGLDETQAEHLFNGMHVNTIDTQFDAVTGSDWFKGLGADQQHDITSFFSAAMSGGNDYSIDYPVKLADGTTKTFKSWTEADAYVKANPGSSDMPPRIAAPTTPATPPPSTTHTQTYAQYKDAAEKDGATPLSEADWNSAGKNDYVPKTVVNNGTFDKTSFTIVGGNGFEFTASGDPSVDSIEYNKLRPSGDSTPFSENLYRRWLESNPSDGSWQSYKNWQQNASFPTLLKNGSEIGGLGIGKAQLTSSTNGYYVTNKEDIVAAQNYVNTHMNDSGFKANATKNRLGTKTAGVSRIGYQPDIGYFIDLGWPNQNEGAESFGDSKYFSRYVSLTDGKTYIYDKRNNTSVEDTTVR